jgi:hypothetical protein
MKKLPFSNLHTNHKGLSKAVAKGYEEAARVCLDRHHRSPTQFEIIHEDLGTGEYEVVWPKTTAKLRNQWANIIDTTEAGGYCFAIAACETHLGMFTIRRAENASGSDYYLSENEDADDLEDAYLRCKATTKTKG